MSYKISNVSLQDMKISNKNIPKKNYKSLSLKLNNRELSFIISLKKNNEIYSFELIKENQNVNENERQEIISFLKKAELEIERLRILKVKFLKQIEDLFDEKVTLTKKDLEDGFSSLTNPEKIFEPFFYSSIANSYFFVYDAESIFNAYEFLKNAKDKINDLKLKKIENLIFTIPSFFKKSKRAKNEIIATFESENLKIQKRITIHKKNETFHNTCEFEIHQIDKNYIDQSFIVFENFFNLKNKTIYKNIIDLLNKNILLEIKLDVLTIDKELLILNYKDKLQIPFDVNYYALSFDGDVISIINDKSNENIQYFQSIELNDLNLITK